MWQVTLVVVLAFSVDYFVLPSVYIYVGILCLLSDTTRDNKLAEIPSFLDALVLVYKDSGQWIEYRKSIKNMTDKATNDKSQPITPAYNFFFAFSPF